MPWSPVRIAHAFVDAINAHDLEAICKLMADDHRFIDSLGAVIQGRDRMRDGWAGYFRMVPDYAITVDETFCTGSIVVMLGVARGTFVRNGQPRPENSWQTPAAWRAQTRDKYVVEWRVYADNEPIRQLMAQATHNS